VSGLDALQDLIVWHDVECGSYAADLALWEQLAGAAGGPILELGCGTGRVTLHLARRGHRVSGIDSDAPLVGALRQRASAEALPVRAELADAATFSLAERFALILAPMQLIQLLPLQASGECLRAAAAHLQPEGVLAMAIVEETHTALGARIGAPPFAPLPDVREHASWVYSSLPLGAFKEGESLVVERLRQAVSPEGQLEESVSTVRMRMLTASSLEKDGQAAGLRPAGRRDIKATENHVGSTVVLMEA
jgi:SAM-dependent methyltransferase